MDVVILLSHIYYRESIVIEQISILGYPDPKILVFR